MKQMKKVEIVIERAFLPTLLEKLKELNIGGYTVLDVAQGNGGKSGNVKDYGVTDINRNSYIFTVCSIDEHDHIITAISPFIEKTGGILICSDVTCFYPKPKD